MPDGVSLTALFCIAFHFPALCKKIFQKISGGAGQLSGGRKNSPRVENIFVNEFAPNFWSDVIGILFNRAECHDFEHPARAWNCRPRRFAIEIQIADLGGGVVDCNQFHCRQNFAVFRQNFSDQAGHFDIDCLVDVHRAQHLFQKARADFG
mgnify:CR=1 FL=1